LRSTTRISIERRRRQRKTPPSLIRRRPQVYIIFCFASTIHSTPSSTELLFPAKYSLTLASTEKEEVAKDIADGKKAGDEQMDKLLDGEEDDNSYGY
jgi:hypothetical protein